MKMSLKLWHELFFKFVFCCSIFDLLSPSLTYAKTTLTLEPRLDTIQRLRPVLDHVENQTLANRALLKGLLELDFPIAENTLQSRLDLFSDLDFSGSRTPSEESDANEAWISWNSSDFNIRVGRQAIRWSPSRTNPSLDYFSGRRYNRIFVDPFPDQLAHPDAIQATLKLGEFNIEYVRILQSAPTKFPTIDGTIPNGASNVDRIDEKQNGLAIRYVQDKLELHLVGRNRTNLRDQGSTDVGAMAKYENYRLEANNSTRGAQHVAAAVEVSNADFKFSPQVTIWRDPQATSGRQDTLLLAPIVYNLQNWSLEGNIIRTIERIDLFTHLRLVYRPSSTIETSVYYQTYQGDPGRLFDTLNKATKGALLGFRLTYRESLNF